MEKLLISACLTGENCKYDGGNNALPPETLAALRGRYELVPVCPEQLGGLPTPRVPSERRGGRVFSRAGEDVTEAFRRGAREALPIYDGSFSGTLTGGYGVAAELLIHEKIEVFGNVFGLI